MTVVKHPTGPVPSVSGKSGNLLSNNGSELVWSPAPEAGGMTLLSTTTLSGSVVQISSINQSYIDLVFVLQAPTFNTSNDSIYFAPNNSESISFYTGVGETSSSSRAIYGANNGEPIVFNYTVQDRANADSTYYLRINNYASTRVKPFQFYGAMVSGDQRSWSSSGGIVQGSGITDMRIRTQNNYTFNGGTLLVYGVK